jgi:hypothetical protein
VNALAVLLWLACMQDMPCDLLMSRAHITDFPATGAKKYKAKLLTLAFPEKTLSFFSCSEYRIGAI